MATMSAIPAGLSFLATMASQYPPFQRAMHGVSSAATGTANQPGLQFGPLSAPANNPVVAQPQPQPPQAAPLQPPTSAPVNIPQTTAATNASRSSQVINTPASSPPTGAHATASNLCEVGRFFPYFPQY